MFEDRQDQWSRDTIRMVIVREIDEIGRVL